MAHKRDPSTEALEAFSALGEDLENRAEVVEARWFGIPAMKVSGKVFLALHGDSLVAKLGSERVDQLVDEGEGERFDPSGKGRAMKDWLESKASPAEWPALSEAALKFVSSDS